MMSGLVSDAKPTRHLRRPLPRPAHGSHEGVPVVHLQRACTVWAPASKASNALSDRLRLLADFEEQFPQSRVLPDVYLMMIDIYRQKADRTKIIEYGEKTLKADEQNITAMMVLSRNYALERKNVDRAVMLAEQAVDLADKMKAGPLPSGYSDAQWKNYVQTTQEAAKSILEYAKTVRGR